MPRNGKDAEAEQEYRAARTLNPSHSGAHYNLGLALEEKSDRRGALEEYRAADTLNPHNADDKNAYERLSRQGQ